MSSRRTRTRSRKKRLAFFAIALLLFAIVVEGAASVAYYLVTGEAYVPSAVAALQTQIAGSAANAGTAGEAGSSFAAHPYLGYVFDPTRSQERGVTPRDLGFLNRGDSILQRGPDRLVVGIFGGSVANHLAAQGADAIRATLAADPRLAGREIVILNCAVPTYKQPQQALALQYLLSVGAEFDVVVNLDGFNEIHIPFNVMAAGIHPAFPGLWMDFGNRAPDAETRRLTGVVEMANAARIATARRFLGFPIPFVTVGLLWRVRDASLAQQLAAARSALGSYRPPERPYSVSGPEVGYADADAVLADLVEIWARGSELMAATCRARQMRYVHCLQPNQYVVGSKPLTAAELATAILESQPLVPRVRAGYPRLLARAAALTAAGVDFRDLTRVFARVDETLYRDTCCHLNEAGNARLGVAVATAVLDIGEIDSWSKPPDDDHSGLVGIAATTPSIDLGRPFAIEQLRLEALYGDGLRRPIDPSRLVVTIDRPEIVEVLPAVNIRARSPGRARATARFRGFECYVDVRVEFVDAGAFGEGSPGTGRRVPRLDAERLANGRVRFTLSNAPPGLNAVLGGTTDASPTLVCGAWTYAPLDRAVTMTARVGAPGVDGTGAVTWEVPPATTAGRATYWQAFVNDPAARCSWSSSQGVVLMR